MRGTEVSYMSLWEPARKLHISEILGGSIESLNDSGRFVLITKHGLKTSRVRVMGTVVDSFKSEISDYTNFTLDDGTGTIRVKTWKSKSAINNIKVGDIIDVIGLVRFHRGEVYLVPELVIKVEDPNWELVRELELCFLRSLASMEVRELKLSTLHKSILKIIDGLDTGDGVSRATLEKLLNVPEDELERALETLLGEGIIYETDDGSYKRLGNLDKE